MVGGLLFIALLIGLIVWLVIKEIDYHGKTGDNAGWRITLIWSLVILLFAPLMQKGCSSDGYSYREPTGDNSFDDR